LIKSESNLLELERVW